MTATIALDLDQLTSHAQRVAAVGNSFGSVVALAPVTGIDVGAFGVLCSRLNYPVQLVSQLARETIVEAGNAVARTAGAVHDVSLDFADFEEASQVALGQLAQLMPSASATTATPSLSSSGAAASELIAAPIDLSTPFTGLGILEDGESVGAAVVSGDWAGQVIGGVSLGLDSVVKAVDPLGTLISMGLSWTLEHMEPLRGWVNDLTGDAGQVAGFARTWRNIGERMDDCADDLDASMGQVADMDGATVAAYRAFQADVVDHVRAAGSWATAFASGLDLCSAVVKGVHDFVRELLSSVIASVIVWAGELAATAMLATPVVLEQLAVRVAALSGRAARMITRLLDAVERFIALLRKMATVYSSLTRVLRSVMNGGTTTTPPLKATLAKPLTSAEPGNGAGAQFSSEQLFAGHYRDRGSDFGATSPAEYLHQADDFLNGPRASGTLEHLRSPSGAIVRFNPDTDEFGIVSADGHIVTYYKPDPALHGYPTNLEYFNARKG